VVFDPRLCFETGQVESIEASVRWVHSRLGRVPPAELASVAAEGGLEVELDRWLLRKACAELKSWRTETVRAATVAISISPRHWSSGELVPTVSRVLQDRGVAGARLQLQLPQEALLADVDQAALVIAGLRGLGVSVVAVHSEVSCTVLYELARLRVDGVKLDTGSLRAFDPDFARTVLSSVCGMMKRAGIRCIAGGLESPAEWSLLREVGCDGAQGPLIATPMSSEYLERLARDSVALRHSRPGSASRARKVVQA
jgi:EAL domain-containing protein (putative c-di-GMP-specific phosphodiesterase class I)